MSACQCGRPSLLNHERCCFSCLWRCHYRCHHRLQSPSAVGCYCAKSGKWVPVGAWVPEAVGVPACTLSLQQSWHACATQKVLVHALASCSVVDCCCFLLLPDVGRGSAFSTVLAILILDRPCLGNELFSLSISVSFAPSSQTLPHICGWL